MVVGGLVGGVVVGGGVVTGGAVVGGAVAGGDLVTGGAVGGVDVELPVGEGVVAGGAVVPVFEPVFVLVPVFDPVFESAPVPPVEVGVVTALDADDFPLERTANQSFATPCPVASPFLVSLAKRVERVIVEEHLQTPAVHPDRSQPFDAVRCLYVGDAFRQQERGHTLAQAPVHVALPAGSTV